jgi:hypothetical protein
MAAIAISTGGTFPLILAFLLEILPNRSVGTASGAALSIVYRRAFRALACRPHRRLDGKP